MAWAGVVAAGKNRVESGITAGFALGVPLVTGSIAAIGMLMFPGWIGEKGQSWQFVVGVGMACAVTALPILILLMEKLDILRKPIGQRILRYASLDDVAIWGVLALVLLDWERMGRQVGFLAAFVVACIGFRKLMAWLPERDRWYVMLIWLSVCAFGADWAGLHFMVGAFLAGVVIDADWFDQEQMDRLRHNVLLVASVAGKLVGVHIAGKILKWKPGEASLIGWLLQTKALIMIIFANILLDKQIITNATFTALLLMAVASTMLTIPVVTPKLKQLFKPGKAA